MKVALVSDIEIERQYFVDSVARVDTVSFISQINTLTSSKVINAGRIIAKENEVNIYGAVGNDDDAAKAIKDLEEYGFNTSNVQKIKKYKTGQVLVITDSKGKSAISVFLGASNHMVNPKLQNENYLYTATSLPLDVLYKLLKLANSKVITFLDVPNNQVALDKKYLQFVDYLIPNRQEAGMLLGVTLQSVKDAISASMKLVELGSTFVIITLDKDGCVVTEKNKTSVHIPAKKVKTIDETGSGDIFRGVFVNAIIKGNNVYDSAESAISIASKSVTIRGVEASITSSFS